jgi:branched-chain amino acid transport system permease protein
MQTPRKRKGQIASILVALLFLLAPFYLPEYATILLISILITSIFAISLNILSGYVGLITLGHAMFWGTGGYAAALLTTKGHVQNFFLVLLIGLGVVTLLSIIVGIIVIRMKRVYFLIITLALGQVIFSLAAYSLAKYTGGTDGLGGVPRPHLFPSLSMANNINFYYLTFLVTALCFFFMYSVRKSPFGNGLLGIRDNEQRMLAMGYNTFVYKFAAFIICAIIAGLGGIMNVYFDQFISPTDLAFSWSGGGLIMLFIGGIGTFWGPLVGTAIYILLRYWVSSYTIYWSLVSGVIFVLVVMFFRGGLVVYVTRLFGRFNLGSPKN